MADKRTVLVTGGTSGIGAATALAFARAGDNVVVTGRDTARGDDVVRAIKEHGGTGLALRCDVRVADDVASAVARTLEEFGRLDVAVNNAGIFGFDGATADLSEEDWDRVVDTNLKGVWLSMKHEIPPMVAQGGGRIVNVAGAFGLIGFAGIPAYAAAKHGVIGLTKVAALEYVAAGIRVNAICPGVTRTPMVDAATGGDPAAEAQFAAEMPIGRLADPREVADAIAWMCAPSSDFLVGHALAFDGGWVIK